MTNRYRISTVAAACFILFNLSFAQDTKVRWERKSSDNSEEINLFHSTQSINLPTNTGLHKDEFEFEISHRFLPLIKDGSKSLFGFDGPANIRFGLTYAFNDEGSLTLGRTNKDDNYDLSLKYKVFSIASDYLPSNFGIRAGAAWSSDVPGRERGDGDNYQFFGQLIYNTLIEKSLGIGLVPSVLINSNILYEEADYSFTLGSYLQYYLSEMFSIMIEWNPTITGWRERNNPLSFGLEIETGGHFFKVIVSNSTRLNSSQFLAGTETSINDANLHIGFNITRLLIF